MPRSSKLLASVCVAALSTGAAIAQENQSIAQDMGLEEIVVTARKREESIQDIPLSITAFSEQAIQRSGIFDVKDVARLAPNVTLQQTGGAGNGRFMPNLTFRGLQNVFPQPRAQVGAVFVDGNYVLGGVNAVNTTDVERVEVMRGPQNAYFGRNTFAGAINFITKTPGDTFKGEASGSASTRGSFNGALSVEGPLVEEKLSGRLSGFIKDKRGHYVAKDGGRLGSESTKSISATLYATPNDNLWVRLRGNYQRDDDGHGSVVMLSPQVLGDTCKGQFINKGTSLSGKQGFNVSLPYFCGSIPSIDDFGEGLVSLNTRVDSPLLASLGNPNGFQNVFLNNSLNDPQWKKVPKPDGMGLQREIKSVALQTQYEFQNGISLAFNFGFDQNLQSALVDADRTNTEIQYAYIPQTSRTQNYELRLRSAQDQSIRWVVGGTYFKSYFASNFGGGGALQYRSRILNTQALSTTPQTSIAVGNNPFATNERASLKAGFGAVDWDIFDAFTLTGELRYQADKSASGGQFLPTFPAVPTVVTFKDWLPRVIGTYKLTDDWNVYASWSRGVLPGVENSGFTSQTAYRQQLIRNLIPDIQPLLDSDVLDSYEIGSKQTLLEGKVRYNLALYYMKWKNAKAQTALILPSTSETNATPFTVPGVTTQGTVEAKGLELEGAALLTRNWELGGGFSLQKSKFLKWGEAGLLRDLAGGQSPGSIPGNVAFGAINWEGNEMQRQPRATANLNTTYRDAWQGDWEWFVRGDVTYTGRAWDSTANIVKSDDFFRTNARLGLERDDLTIELYVLNLFNDKTWDYISRSLSTDVINNATNIVLPLGNTGGPQGIAAQAPDKRDVGVRVKYSF